MFVVLQRVVHPCAGLHLTRGVMLSWVLGFPASAQPLVCELKGHFPHLVAVGYLK